MRKYLDRLVPRYSQVYLFLAVFINCIVYFGLRPLTAGRHHYSMALPLDQRLPFLPFFCVFYFLAYVQWVLGFILIARESEPFCRKYLTAEILSKLLCGLLFLLLPTTLERPVPSGTGIFERAVTLLYRIDAPDHLFPSLHCLESWVCLRSSLRMKKVGKGYRFFSLVMTVLVFLSTIFLKQHVLLDIPGGILVYECGMFLAVSAETYRTKLKKRKRTNTL